jgi:ABC-2 type transport system permease protein
MRFPRLAVPLSVSLTAAFNLGMNLIAVFIFAVSDGLTPSVSWLQLIPIVMALIIFGTGLGAMLSAFYVRFRDMAPIWEVALQVWFYASPIMYTAGAYGSHDRVSFGSDTLQHLAMINPIATLFTQMGHALIGGPHFPSAVARGGVGPVALALALIFGAFALGGWVFAREAPRVAEHL